MTITDAAVRVTTAGRTLGEIAGVAENQWGKSEGAYILVTPNSGTATSIRVEFLTDGGV